ncbi:hypothetical protein DH2020_036150 [Rehmannia glutinosa]|uniref:MADS-box domain-containing protein n=1 Tax=Rehmannia glutinosa TaxID=99300 RepID=A0ABR0V4U0_REHGL
MGRAKLNMELISKEKSRNITFKKRKEGLIRKMHEFTTLCDVSACMIIYGPKQEKGNNFTEPEIWPQNIDEVRRIIDIYKAKNKDSGNKTFGLFDFFHDRRRKIEEELAKLKKKNMESKYPTWLEFMNFMSEIRLREFAAGLSNKAEYVKSRIELLRRNKQGLIDHHLDMNNLMDFSAHHVVINQQAAIHYPTNTTIDHHHHQNSMMMLLMNDHHNINDHCVQFGGAASSSSGNIQCASYKRQFFYESMAGRAVVDPNMMSQSPKPLARVEKQVTMAKFEKTKNGESYQVALVILAIFHRQQNDENNLEISIPILSHLHHHNL